MDENRILDELHGLAERFGIKIRCEPIKQEEDLIRITGGLCLLKGEYLLIIDSKATMRDRIRTLAEALRHFDLARTYIQPALRELLEQIPEKKPLSQPVDKTR